MNDPSIRPFRRDPQSVLLLDDDSMITDGLAAGLERDGRTVITCNDIESAEMIVDRFQPSHIVADIRLSGPFGCEGLDFIRYARRHAPDSRVILMSGEGCDAVQLEGSERGAVAFLQKPFAVGELDAILDLIASADLSPAYTDGRLIRMPLLDEVLSSPELKPFFQPIVALDASSRVVGYESLARYHSDSPFRNPEMLFQYAARKRRVSDLEFACFLSTMQVAPLLPGSPLIFMNVHPDVFDCGVMLPERLSAYAAQYGTPLDRIVVEITEQASLAHTRAVFAAVDGLREAGVRFAFDDVGVAYSHLPLIGRVRPAFMKISQDLGTGFESDPTKVKIVRSILSLAADFDCEVILEGIEDRSTADAAAELAIAYGQGFLFGRPADPALMSGDGAQADRRLLIA